MIGKNEKKQMEISQMPYPENRALAKMVKEFLEKRREMAEMKREMRGVKAKVKRYGWGKKR